MIPHYGISQLVGLLAVFGHISLTSDVCWCTLAENENVSLSGAGNQWIKVRRYEGLKATSVCVVVVVLVILCTAP